MQTKTDKVVPLGQPLTNRTHNFHSQAYYNCKVRWGKMDTLSTFSSIMTIIINFSKCFLACFCYQTLYNCSETANTILCLNIFILYKLMCDPPRCPSFPWNRGKMDII